MTDAVATLRPASQVDAAAIADAWLASFRATYDFPPAHDDGDVHRWVATILLPGTETWVATVDGEVAGFVSFADGALEQLYVRPGWTGRRLGSRLLARAKERSPDGLELWTFQVNAGARRFYERHGFRAVEWTDGTGNEERQPDVRYAWP